jgi:predicted small lipoprotein YifL
MTSSPYLMWGVVVTNVCMESLFVFLMLNATISIKAIKDGMFREVEGTSGGHCGPYYFSNAKKHAPAEDRSHQPSTSDSTKKQVEEKYSIKPMLDYNCKDSRPRT